MKQKREHDMNELELFVMAPKIVQAIGSKQHYSDKEIAQHMDHVNDLIEKPRLEYFCDAGIKPVPHPLTPGEVEEQVWFTTNLWLQIRDAMGANLADKYIATTSRMLAQQDASKAGGSSE